VVWGFSLAIIRESEAEALCAAALLQVTKKS
jgi:hypothetical protein